MLERSLYAKGPLLIEEKPVVLVGMATEIEFGASLRSLSTHYDQWRKFYTPTDAQTRTQQEQSPFDFGLMVQTVQKDRDRETDEG
jgi:hypothetical protein